MKHGNVVISSSILHLIVKLRPDWALLWDYSAISPSEISGQLALLSDWWWNIFQIAAWIAEYYHFLTLWHHNGTVLEGCSFGLDGSPFLCLSMFSPPSSQVADTTTLSVLLQLADSWAFSSFSYPFFLITERTFFSITTKSFAFSIRCCMTNFNLF